MCRRTGTARLPCCQYLRSPRLAWQGVIAKGAAGSIRTMQVLLQEGGSNNILSGLTRSEFREVRQLITQAILATDMSRHMQHCAEVAKYAQRAKSLYGTTTSPSRVGADPEVGQSAASAAAASTSAVAGRPGSDNVVQGRTDKFRKGAFVGPAGEARARRNPRRLM